MWRLEYRWTANREYGVDIGPARVTAPALSFSQAAV
jgi:hypothetical protein